MASIYPNPISPDTDSDAERKLYTLFRDQLSSEYTVIHSAKWVSLNPNQGKPVGEIDFVIAHPRHGVLMVEAKGGGVGLDENGAWYSIDRTGKKNNIDDPVQEANRAVYALGKHLRNHRVTRSFDIPIFHAVTFPDIEVSPQKSLRPDIHRTIILDRSRLDHVQKAIEEIFEYWRQRFPYKKMEMQAVAGITQVLAPKFEIRTRISHVFEEEDQQIKKLTESQYATLRKLQMVRRAKIVGGAGTGKTMLAFEKARQLSEAGFKVLLLCYNRNLANWLKQLAAEFNGITVQTFDSLVSEYARITSLANITTQAARLNRVSKADSLFDSLDIIRRDSTTSTSYLYDAVIVDEAQDFESDYWIPIQELLRDRTNGILYTFLDANQRIYTQLSDIPIDQDPYTLDENCRNTQAVFNVLLPYAVKTIPMQCIGPEGRKTEIRSALNGQDVKKTLQSTLHDLVNERGAHPSQIIVLTPRKEENSLWKEGLTLGNYKLTWDLNNLGPVNIRVSTIHSFKGLESPIVILTELEHAFEETRDQLIYIGMSRARNHLVIIGSLPSPNHN